MNFENPLWQSREWEKFQTELGHITWRIQDVLIIQKKTVFGKKFWEIPRASLANISKEFWKEFVTKAREENSTFTRIFPADEMDPEMPISLQINRKNIPEIFPENTLILDLQKSTEELLSEMKPKGRYNIALAEKKGVLVRKSEDVAAFHRLLQETTSRDGFSGHPEAVYRKMLQAFGENGLLLLAEYEGKIIAGGIFLFCENTATYYYGASANEYRNVMAPYLVQWEAVREAQKRGCTHYDFLGIAPEGAEQHKLSGVSQFKEKFGGTRVEYAPAFEVVHQKYWYFLLNTAKKFRNIF